MEDIKFPTRYSMRRAIGESDFSESLTVPDQSMSVLEILQRFAQGIDPGLTKVPIYEDGADDDILEDYVFDSPDDLADLHPDEINTLLNSSQNKLKALSDDKNNDDDDKTTTTIK